MRRGGSGSTACVSGGRHGGCRLCGSRNTGRGECREASARRRFFVRLVLLCRHILRRQRRLLCAARAVVDGEPRRLRSRCCRRLSRRLALRLTFPGRHLRGRGILRRSSSHSLSLICRLLRNRRLGKPVIRSLVVERLRLGANLFHDLPAGTFPDLRHPVTGDSDGFACSLRAPFRRFLCLQEAGGERPGRREQHRADEADADDDDGAVDAEEPPDDEEQAAADETAAARQALRQDLRTRYRDEMMIRREREREKRRETEETQRIAEAVVLRHVLPADEQDEQHDERGPHAEEIMQAFGKRQSHETDIEPREPAGGNQSRSEKEQSDELIAAAGRGGRGLSARRLPPRLRRAGRGFLRGCFLFQGITS